jgi:hypothetical protein
MVGMAPSSKIILGRLSNSGPSEVAAAAELVSRRRWDTTPFEIIVAVLIP